MKYNKRVRRKCEGMNRQEQLIKGQQRRTYRRSSAEIGHSVIRRIRCVLELRSLLLGIRSICNCESANMLRRAISHLVYF